MRKFTFVCFGTLIAGLATPTFACDGVVRSKPVVSANSVSLIVQSTQFVPVEDRLKQGIEKTKQHVCYCQSDVSEASRQLDSIVKKRDSIVSTQAKDFDSMKLLRDLLKNPGSSVCIDGKSFTKEKIATSLIRTLEKFELASIDLDNAESELQSARETLAALQAKAQRWQAAQKLLVSRVDRVIKAEQDRRQTLANESAKNEAIQLVEAIEAKIARAHATAKATSQPLRPAPAVVSQAIAEFDAIFGN